MFAPYVNPKLPTRPRPEDQDDVRLGNFVRSIQAPLSEILPQIKKTDFIVLGYPDDRGVDRNGGRLGASDGPDEIRKFLYNMTPDARHPFEGRQIWDIGNLRSWSLNLVEAHEEARKALRSLRETGARVITLGGGHDWAYPDFADFKDRVLNLDAHLDMRPVTDDADASAHSGTPFRKILNARKDGSNFGVIGLQRHCNASTHLEYAKSLRVSCVFLDELPWDLEAQWTYLQNKLGLRAESDRFAMSVDLDAFPQSEAPGVSAPQALGLDPRLALRLIETLGQRSRHLGIYELNPLYDRDGATARLAAKLIHAFLHVE